MGIDKNNINKKTVKEMEDKIEKKRIRREIRQKG